jgi:hypothetical protein
LRHLDTIVLEAEKLAECWIAIVEHSIAGGTFDPDADPEDNSPVPWGDLMGQMATFTVINDMYAALSNTIGDALADPPTLNELSQTLGVILFARHNLKLLSSPDCDLAASGRELDRLRSMTECIIELLAAVASLKSKVATLKVKL